MEHATKTDLSLLLECLKCQMKCPDSQKQALLTIYAICHQSGENVEYFHDLGGVMFVHGLSQSSPHPPVKQAALFILGALTESNDHCKQALCKRETFLNLLESLQVDVPITQKRVAVYMMSALVSNNRSGQEFAHTSDCIQVLLDLFRWSFPLSSEAETVGEPKMIQLWTAVSSALCACVNNPQNDLNQRVCMSAFPLVCSWLQQMSPPRPDLLQPVCSFIAMTLHNNSCAQEYFSSVGGLGTLCVSLADLVPLSAQSPPACRMAIMLTKTLAACVTENSGLAAGLSALQLVPVLVLLLSCPTLDQRDQLSVVLTMGLCTDSSEEHQLQLLANGGLPLVISLLTETQDEELKKAATFVLQTCKKITGMLAPDLRSGHEDEHQSELESHWKSAREILQRINNLEKQQLQAEEEQWERDVGNSTDQQEGTFGIPYAPPPQTPSLQRSDPTEEFWEGTPLRSVRGHQEGRLRHRNKTYKEQPVRRDIFKSVSERDQPLQTHHATAQDSQREKEREMEDRGGETGSSRCRDHALTETREKRERRRDVEREAWRNGEREGWRDVERERWKDGEKERRRDGDREIEKDWAERESEGERGTDGGWSRIPIEREGDMKERGRRGQNRILIEREGDMKEREGRGRPTSRIPAHLDSASLTDTYNCLPAEGDEHTDRMPGPLLSFAPQLKPPVPSEDEMSICSEVLEQEIQRVLLTPASFTHSALRCLGCVSGVCDVSSRSFTALLHSSQQKCETHLLLLRTDQRHRQQLKRTHTLSRDSDTHTLTHISGTHTLRHTRGTHTLTLTQCSDTHSFTHGRHTHTLRGCPPGHTHGSPECGFCTVDTHCKSDRHCEGDTHPHTPLPPREAEASHTHSQPLGDTDGRDGRTHNLTHRDELTAVNLTPLKRPPHMPVRGRYREEQMSKDEANIETSEGHYRRRNRKDFSEEELAFLLQGVRRFGPSWNSILWAYPFQSGRTNVDLAQKYRRMKKTEATL